MTTDGHPDAKILFQAHLRQLTIFHRKVLPLKAESVRVHSIQMTVAVSMFGMLGDAAGSLPALRDNSLIVALLILVLGFVLGIGFTCLLLVVHFSRKAQLAIREPHWKHDYSRDRKFPHHIFQAPNRWLAIKSNHPHVVQAALGLHKPMPCTWEEGLTVAHEQKLFISPPLGGWILVMGSRLPEPADDVDKCFRFILDLSRKLGHVQYFSTNRAVNHHAWVQAYHGQVQRAYAWAGKTLWNQGRVTQAELDLRLKCFDYGEAVPRVHFAHSDPTFLNAERVPLLAARWSVDPNAIDARMLKESQGIAGELSRSRTR
jgi:hypothetical protein